MNPYLRFGLVSNTISSAIIVGSLAVFGPGLFSTVQTAAGGSGATVWMALGTAVAVLVVFWIAMTEAIFPTLFRINAVRRLILGKYYVEGTWLQAERAGEEQRMAVIDIQPAGKSFIFSGYALNQDLEVESNSLIEFSRVEWPFMTYKYRNSLSDGTDGMREGVGEIQFEMNRETAKRYNGFIQHVRATSRIKIEGAKLTSNREVKYLRSLEGRQKIFRKYWDLFFNRTLKKGAAAAPITDDQPEAPVEITSVSDPSTPQKTVSGDNKPAAEEPTVVPRRRATDWSSERTIEETRNVVAEAKTVLNKSS